jgi:hypothetical protein
MNSKNLLTPRPKSPYRLDPNSDRYRVCPNDGVEFMAAHRSTIFCNPKCADEFHNEKKRLAAEKQLQEEITKTFNVPIKETEVLSEQSNVSKEVIPTSTTVVTSPLVGNINLIGATLGNSPYIIVYKKYLTGMGLDYSVYDNKYQMPGTEVDVLTFGPYAIAWGYENHVILTYKNKIPWIQ